MARSPVVLPRFMVSVPILAPGARVPETSMPFDPVGVICPVPPNVPPLVDRHVARSGRRIRARNGRVCQQRAGFDDCRTGVGVRTVEDRDAGAGASLDDL